MEGDERMFSPFLGKEYQDVEIEHELENYKSKLNSVKSDDVFYYIATEIADGKIIGWFQERSECGPRSLGNRSILADPRRSDMKDFINKQVKFREPFRPFAPAVLWEKQKEYFDLEIPSPYMLMVANVLKEKKDIIPAVTHVDGTARLQTVLEELSPRFYKLIQSFEKLTGVPVVLNTSFNIRGEPIVEEPKDAIECFLKTNIDILCLGDYIIKKK